MKTIMFPGQGSQYKGMGKKVIEAFPHEINRASEILGYDLAALCLQDPRKQLDKTQYTQPALYVVNALTYRLQYGDSVPDFAIGHSLGEYNALLVAGAYDFETGLRLVQKRGAMMAEAAGGGMAAVLGIEAGALREKLQEGGYTGVDIANYNTPSQTVIAGPKAQIDAVVEDFEAREIKIIPLFVTAAFHSRYMQPAAAEFARFLQSFAFQPIRGKVIANASANLYKDGHVAQLLSQQIASSVNWIDTIRLLMGYGVSTYEEISSGLLTKMVKEIQTQCKPIVPHTGHSSAHVPIEPTKATQAAPDTKPLAERPVAHTPKMDEKAVNTALAAQLGSESFRKAYGIRFAYLTGGMYRGIASKELVVLMGKAKLLGFLGTGGLGLERIEEDIQYIQSHLSNGEAYGMNLLHNMEDPVAEMELVSLYLKYGVTCVEAAAFMQITPALVYYRLQGLKKMDNGQVVAQNKIIAKLSRPEVAENFMHPAPERIVKKLLAQGLVSEQQAEWAKQVPMSNDICVEADSGGHTDGGIATVLFPAVQSLKESVEAQRHYAHSIHIGLAGGIGTPNAVACAFVMGADFVLTGSVNQCTVEAGIGEQAKDLLQAINVQDTDYAPAGDMFELGARIQVLKKGVLFPARSNRLYQLYQQYTSLEEIPEKVKQKIVQQYFKMPLEQVWEETKQYLREKGDFTTLKKAEEKPKVKMAMVFRWYFGYSSRLSFEPKVTDQANLQIHTGPALGAFNQWVGGTPLEDWRNRHADEIACMLMENAAKILVKSQLKAPTTMGYSLAE